MQASIKDILRTNLERKIQLTAGEFDLFYTKFTPLSYRKKEHLLHTGEICDAYFFITEGLVKSYYHDEKGKEHITAFAIENWWVTDLEGFFTKRPSKLNIQALEETRVLAIQYKELHQVFEDIPSLNVFFRIQMQNMVMALQRRHHFYMKLDGKERYDFLVKTLPDFVQRVPQYMLASYLELTPEYLSELRKKTK